MGSKSQELRIKHVDHRGDGEPDVDWESFTDHRSYLRRMRELMRPPPGVNVSEKTFSVVHYTEESEQPSMFDD